MKIDVSANTFLTSLVIHRGSDRRSWMRPEVGFWQNLRSFSAFLRALDHFLRHRSVLRLAQLKSLLLRLQGVARGLLGLHARFQLFRDRSWDYLTRWVAYLFESGPLEIILTLKDLCQLRFVVVNIVYRKSRDFTSSFFN